MVSEVVFTTKSSSMQLVSGSQLSLASMLSQEAQSKFFFVLQILGS